MSDKDIAPKNKTSRIKKLISIIKRPKREAESGAHLEKRHVVHVTGSGWIPKFSQIRYLPRLLNQKENIVLKGALALFVVGIILTAWSFFGSFGTLEPRSGGNYTEVVVGKPELINPLWSDSNDVDRDLVRLVYAGLLRYDSNLNLIGDLAKNYEISEDGKTYTFHLQENLLWSDNEPLTSSDVVFTITSVKSTAWKSTRASEFVGVNIEAPDPNTVVFTLEEPFAPFLHSLTIGILPEHLWTNIAPEHARLAELNLKPVGAGPYQIAKIRKTTQGNLQSYTMERNKNYYGTKPNIAEIIFKFSPSNQEAVAVLASGNAQGMGFVPLELQKDLKRRTDLEYHKLNLSQIVAIFFNQKQNILLTPVEVRQALANAAPREAIIKDAFKEAAVSISGPMLPGSLGYINDISRYEEGIDQARATLDNEGWRLQENATVRTFSPTSSKDKRYIKGTELTVNITTVNIPEYVRTAELIRDAWKEIGVKTEITTVNPGQAVQDVISKRSYDTLLFGLLMSADPDPYPFWHSSQATETGVNLAQYANRKVDALIEEARTLQKPEDRAARYEEFQKILTKDLPAIFLLQPTYIYAVDNSIRGINITNLATPADRFIDIASWYTKTMPALK